MKKENIKLIAYFISVFCIFSILFYALGNIKDIFLNEWKGIFLKEKFPSEITWKVFDENSRKNSFGFLYSIEDKVTKDKYMFASDRLLIDNDYNTNLFEYTLLNESRIWDPKACAKMPSIISQAGNLYMVDYTFDGEKSRQTLIKYEKSSGLKYEYDLKNTKVIGKIYKEENKIYFFVSENNIIKKMTLEDNLNKISKIKKDILYNLDKNESINLSMSKDKNLIFTLSIDLIPRKYFIFNNENNKSEEMKEKPDTLNISYDNNYLLTNLSNSSKSYMNLNNQLETGIWSQGGVYKRVLSNDSNAYLYIIDNY